MGAGLALQFKKKYPQIFDDYMAAYKAGHLKLGNVVITKIHNNLYIASICGQENYGTNKNQIYTDYNAVIKGLDRIQKFSIENLVNPIYIPYLMGCGLGGGDWNTVIQCMYMTTKDAIIVRRY